MAHLAAAPGRQRHVRHDRRRLPRRRRSARPARPAGSPTIAAMRRACRTTSPTRSPRRRSCSRPGSPTPDAIAAALAAFVGPPHRSSSSARPTASRWFNDSKATTPHAAATAIRAFDSRRADRRRQPQGRRPVADGRRRRSACVPSSRSARPPPDIPPTFDGATHGRRRRRRWPRPSTPPPTSPARRRRRALAGLRQLRLVPAATRPAATTSAGSSPHARRSHDDRMTHVRADDRSTDCSSSPMTITIDRGPARPPTCRRPPVDGGARAPARRSTMHGAAGDAGAASRRRRAVQQAGTGVWRRPARPGAGRLLRDRRHRRRVRDARPRDGAVGDSASRSAAKGSPVRDLQPAGDVGRRSGWSA